MAQLGVHDAAAVMTEPFRQWVIEDRFAGPRPPWEVGGAQWVSRVGPYETAKLRMLNGAHSALAYIGLARGHELVAQAIADPALSALINVLMREEAARSFTPAPEQDLDTYADLLLARFANVARPHRLRQIAMDGSQKIPQRWLDTLRIAQSQGRRCNCIVAGTWARGLPTCAAIASRWRIRRRRSWRSCGGTMAWRASPGRCSAPADASRSGPHRPAELDDSHDGREGLSGALASHVLQFHALGLMNHGAHEEE